MKYSSLHFLKFKLDLKQILVSAAEFLSKLYLFVIKMNRMYSLINSMEFELIYQDLTMIIKKNMIKK